MVSSVRDSLKAGFHTIQNHAAGWPMSAQTNVLDSKPSASHPALQIKPLSDALGAEVLGLDLSRPVTGSDLKNIQSAFLEYHLLCFRSEPLTPRDFARVARYFGEPQLQLLRNQRVDDVPEVSILESTYKTADDKPDDLTLVRLSGWHTDDSYFEIPAKATMLQVLSQPDSGGETRFCNTRRRGNLLGHKQRARTGTRGIAQSNRKAGNGRCGASADTHP